VGNGKISFSLGISDSVQGLSFLAVECFNGIPLCIGLGKSHQSFFASCRVIGLFGGSPMCFSSCLATVHLIKRQAVL
jgi:hypothetical protein